MDLTRKDFLKGAISLAAEVTLSPITRAASGVLAVGFATRSATATPIVLVGADSVNAYVYGSGSPNIVVSSLFTAVASGTATSLSIHINLEAGNSIKLSIWTADGLTKLGETAPFADAVGIQTANLLSGVSIVSGVSYLLAAMSSGPYIWVNNDGTGFQDFTTDATYPSWPASIPLFSNSGGGKVALWAQGEDSAETFDFYIGPTGSNSNDGSLASPWAITALNDTSKRELYRGTKVGLLDGTYSVYSILTDGSHTTQDDWALNVEGGTSGSPTIIKSVNPRGAHITARSGSNYGNVQGAPMIGHSGTTTNRGYVTFDGLKISGNVRHGIRIGTIASSPQILGIVIQNCEFTDFSAVSAPYGLNLGQIELNNTTGAIIRNNLFHDNVGYAAGSADHFSCCVCWETLDSIIEYNTVYNQASGFLGKQPHIYGTTFRYNYIDCSTGTSDTPVALFSYSGDDSSGAGNDDDIHNNVLIAQVPYDGRSVYYDSRHTYHRVKLRNNTLIVHLDHGYGYFIRVEDGLFDCWNNIITTVATGDQAFAVTHPQANGLINYNLFYRASGASQWATTPDASSNARDNYYTTLATWTAAIGPNSSGGRSADQDSIAGSNPLFVGSGARALYYQLQSGSPARNAGRTNGASSGSACDMGAWGGATPPSRIGCDF